jgi:uncharacterized protein (DUF1800 family)
MSFPRICPWALLAALALAAGPLLSPPLSAAAPTLANLSARAQITPGNGTLVSGFVIGPGAPTTVLVRAVGPGLTALGVSDPLPDPALTLYDAAGTQLGSNQGWSQGTVTADLMNAAGAFALPTGSADSALVATLATGAYTAAVGGAGTGAAQIEVYAVNADGTTGPLVNLSTRGEVSPAAPMTGGFVLSGVGGTRTLLIRACGPALAGLGLTGTLANPALTVLNAAGVAVAINDDWGSPVAGGATAGALSAAATQAGAMALATGSLDAAVLTNLPPGTYTVQVSGADSGGGLALLEIYDVTAGLSSRAATAANTVAFAAATGAADTSGSNPATVTVTRTGDTSQALPVAYSVAGTAVNGVDYPALTGTVTIPAGSASATITIAPNPTVATVASTTVVLTLSAGTGYSVGAIPADTITITNLPPTLYIVNLRPTSNAPTSTGSGVGTVLLSSAGTLASVNVSFSNLSSDEVVAHLAIGGDMNNGTYVLNLPNGQVSNFPWAITAVAQYSAAQIVAALQAGNLYLEIDSATYPGGELGGQFIQGTGSQNFTAPASSPMVSLATVTASDGPRFLTQATFGVTAADLASLTSLGYTQWIANQMALPATSHRQATDADAAYFPNTGSQYPVTSNNRQAAWWKIVTTAPDQLRQRVAFALSEILVVSDVASSISNYPDGLANYYDMLARDAFGNFRTLLQDVTLSPVMGNYLTYLRNAKANPATGTAADENYAREVMQLFTIGLNLLQPDGTLKLDTTGLPIPTYNQATIVQTANVFTGWSYYQATANPSFYGGAVNFDQPMMLYPAYHDVTAKTIVGGVVLPANQDGATDLKMELDTLFNHQNTGPFLAQQLIQRLVTSNPSPGYVYRVAQVFANDGTGVRGNLAAVVQAILLDYEARASSIQGNVGYGKLKEPLIQQTNLYRSLNATATNGRFAIFNAQTTLTQAALRSPTVFNFFSPDYVPSGGLASAGLVGPEFQNLTASTAITIPNTFYASIYSATGGLNLDLSSLTVNAANPTALVSTLNTLFAQGNMSAAAQARIVTAIKALPANTAASAVAQFALYLTVTSPDGAIQK